MKKNTKAAAIEAAAIEAAAIEAAALEKLEKEEKASLVEDEAFVRFDELFTLHAGWADRGLCKALRAIAAEWEFSRKLYIEAAGMQGIDAGTAARQWQEGRA